MRHTRRPESWDGRDDLGQAVLDGRYRLEVSARAAVRAAKQSVALQLDTRAPALQVANLPDGLRVGVTARCVFPTHVGVDRVKTRTP